MDVTTDVIYMLLDICKLIPVHFDLSLSLSMEGIGLAVCVFQGQAGWS